MKKCIVIFMLLLCFSCSTKKDKQIDVKEVKTNFTQELYNIIREDTFDQVVICNNLSYQRIMKTIPQVMNDPFGVTIYGKGNVSIHYYYEVNKRIISVWMMFNRVKNPQISQMTWADVKNNKRIADLFSNEVPDTIHIENMNISRYYHSHMITGMEKDSSIYDFYIPDTIKFKLGLPKDYQSALPILSDTNIFR